MDIWQDRQNHETTCQPYEGYENYRSQMVVYPWSTCRVLVLLGESCIFRFETMAKILATCDSSALLKGSARRLLRWHSNIPHILSAAHQTRLTIGIFELDSYLSYSLSTTLLKAGQLKCQGPSGNAQARKSRIGCLRNVQTEESPRKSALF
jgi:hypothetical protein